MLVYPSIVAVSHAIILLVIRSLKFFVREFFCIFHQHLVPIQGGSEDTRPFRTNLRGACPEKVSGFDLDRRL